MTHQGSPYFWTQVVLLDEEKSAHEKFVRDNQEWW